MKDRTRCEACGLRTMQLRAAERLAAAVNILVRRGQLDARSLPGDELLNYYQQYGAPEIPTEEESLAVLKEETHGDQGQ